MVVPAEETATTATMATASARQRSLPWTGLPLLPKPLDRHEQAAHVRRVLDALPAEQSQVIQMAFFSDLSHHEISARLAQPLGTVKARIRRGLLKLRDGLKGGGA